jgi:hypothetical protein
VKINYARPSRQHLDLDPRRRALGAARAKGKELFRSWRSAHPSSLLTIAILLCLGALLFYWAAVPKSEAPAALTTAGATRAEHVASGHEPPIGGNYLAVFADEGELGDELPPNATLLTALVVVVFYGTVMRWCFPSIVWLHQRRPVPALLGAFRLQEKQLAPPPRGEEKVAANDTRHRAFL